MHRARIAVQLGFRLNFIIYTQAVLRIGCNMHSSCAEFFGEPHTWPPSHTWSAVVRRTSIMSGNNQSQCIPSAVKRLALFGSWYKHKLCRLHTEDLCREPSNVQRCKDGWFQHRFLFDYWLCFAQELLSRFTLIFRLSTTDGALCVPLE